MMKRLSYYIMLLGIVFFTSCEDFLDQVPKHNLTLDNAVTDYSGAKKYSERDVLDCSFQLCIRRCDLVSLVFTGRILLVIHG